MQGSSNQGTLNPWRMSKRKHELPNWDDDVFETPFGAMTELISQWPGHELIAQQNNEERHRKFLEMISGYCMVLNGRRPHDVPLHPRSQVSFKILSFLDKIFPINSDKEWHSLSTMLLHYDLNTNTSEDTQTIPDQIIFHHFMHSIRTGSLYHEKEYDEKELHREEKDFITVLHSQDHDRKKYWPKRNEGGLLEFDGLQNPPELYINTISIRKGRNFNLHTFKFAKIQTWIKEWGYLKQNVNSPENTIIDENNAHPFFIGASSLLDSISATIRSHILAEKRPGSIIIDGGGRISYLSKKSHKEEQEWLAEVVKKSFMIQREHTNPFNSIIVNAATEYIHSPIVAHTYKLHHIDPDTWTNAHKNQPNASFFREELGETRVAHLLPQIHYFDTMRVGNKTFEPSTLLELPPTKDWRQNRCCLCNPTTQQKKYNTPNDLLSSGIFVCFFHYLLHAVGKSTILRNKSLPFLFSGQNMVTRKQTTTVRHLLKFDGNAVGSLFINHVYDFKNDSRGLDHEMVDKSIDLNHQLDLTSMPTVELQRNVRQLRHNALILRQRRSTIFNSSWWSALHRSLKSSQIKDFSPWIVAGDDVLFANEASDVDEEAILKWLAEFINIVTQKIGDVPLSLAGGIYKRQAGESILKSYQQVCWLEELSGHAWKRLHINSKGKFVPSEKQIKLEHFESEAQPEFAALLDWLGQKNNKFVFRWNGMQNIIVPNSWNFPEE